MFLNNDIEIVRSGWLREMVSHAIRPDVGCVGAKLLYPDRRIQHAGVVLHEGPLAMHAFRLLDANDLGYDAQLAGVRSYLAVTAACLAVRAAVFREVGGFDEVGLQIAYNDIDLCLKVDEHGYRNICTPFEPLVTWRARRGVRTLQPRNRLSTESNFLAWSLERSLSGRSICASEHWASLGRERSHIEKAERERYSRYLSR